jgi:hypothetical protein
LVIDTTQATGSNRVKLYVNGVQQTLTFSTTPSQNADLAMNAASRMTLGTAYDTSSFLDCYLTEVNFIDGLALDPSYFGFNNSDTGVWSPKQYTGTYGTNGFYLNFSDNSGTTSTTLGKDYSGNGNNFTPNNFSVTAGVGNDSLVDSPTSYGTDTGVGGEVRGNYCTWNPLHNKSVTLTNGNLDGSTSSGMVVGTIAVSSGKWYWECTPTDTTVQQLFGIIAVRNTSLPNYPGGSSDSYGYYATNGNKYNNSSSSSYGASYGNGDVIGVALDLDAGTLVFYKNGSSQGTAYSSLSGTFAPASGDGATNAWTANFGQRAFAYTAPSGFKALCTQNLPTPTIGATSTTQANDYFDATVYTGTGSALTVTNSGMQPDWVWIKNRTSAGSSGLWDAIRGVNQRLISNLTNAEDTNSGVSAFNSNGFSVGTAANYNTNGNSFIAWQWRASNAAGVTNTAGTITSTVSASTTSGFSIVTYTGNATAGATVGHGLGVAPSMIIVKSRANATGWVVGHSNLNNGTNPWQWYLSLELTAAQGTTSLTWNNTAPTSTVFSLGSGSGTNPSATMVAYCFAPVAGYSAFGSYTGNASTDGPFIYTGFRPRFIFGKDSGGTNNWWIFDSARDTYNVAGKILRPNLSDAELDSPPRVDLLSNGFKIRSVNLPNDATTYIYAAFAESPFKYALAR